MDDFEQQKEADKIWNMRTRQKLLCTELFSFENIFKGIKSSHIYG